VSILGHQLRLSQVELVTDLDPDEPLLYADAHQLHQVIVNLVNNARQALSAWDGERRITITTRAAAADGFVSLEIEDSGPGVPADVQERIFDAFFTTKPVGEGTGLGLSLCRGIVESHGGCIHLDSPDGGGARFVVELPAEPDAAPTADAADEAVHLPPLSVLVVDDERDVAEALAELLRHGGHEVELCHSGAQAADQARRQDYDLILLDLRMPDMDGTRVYTALAEAALDDRVVFCSGDTLSAGSAAFLERTGALVLTKPFSMDDVGRVLRLHVARRAARAEAAAT
jgi:two-component system NtrC family sensor kinase